jgi:hypothetical protein
MTATDHDAFQRSPAPQFSAWSPVVAVVGALIAESSPGWVTALTWVLGVLCALPFKKFRAVVPLALLTWTAGWLVSFVLGLTEGGIAAYLVG